MVETFAPKVKGEGSLFDPMLEEDRGWVRGRAPGHNLEVVEEVIEAMVEGNKPTAKAQPIQGKTWWDLTQGYGKKF